MPDETAPTATLADLLAVLEATLVPALVGYVAIAERAGLSRETAEELAVQLHARILPLYLEDR